MAKKIIFPAKITIVFDRDDTGEISIVKTVAKFVAAIDEYPEFPRGRIRKMIDLTPAQGTQIINFCKNVVLPQLD